MSIRTKSPFSTYPATKQARDKAGRPVFVVTPKYLTPLLARIADIAALLAAAGLTWKGVEFAAALPDAPTWHLGAALIGPWIALPIITRAFRSALKISTTIKITPEHFSVKTLTGWIHFDRALPHSIRLVPHDKAKAEEERQALAQRRAQMAGKIISHTRYYGESFHVSYQPLDQRNDLLTVFGRKDALAILERLKACDAVMDAHAQKADGVPLNPKGEWKEQPGEIPEDA